MVCAPSYLSAAAVWTAFAFIVIPWVLACRWGFMVCRNGTASQQAIATPALILAAFVAFGLIKVIAAGY